MKRALITGISGQDGSYLAELLLDEGFAVYGMIRRNSVAENQSARIDGLSVETFYGDVTDMESCSRVVREVLPDVVFNLAAQSHVRISFDIPEYTTQTNALGALHMLEACRVHVPDCRFYQASSSEMFGSSIDDDGFQRESTPMHPTSPYGCAKLYAYSMVRHYRQAYGMFASNGILFNHESPRRGSNFVTGKIVKTAVQIANGEADKLVLGNLDSYRDWGHARDYVRAMHMILSHTEPLDVVVATGVTRSVRDLCNEVFGQLNLDYRDYVTQDGRYMRPQELPRLCGDASKAREIIGWTPTVSFRSMMQEMIEAWNR